MAAHGPGTYVDVEVSMLAGDDLHPGHDMIEEFGVNLLHEGVRGGIRQRNVQQLHQRLDGPTLKLYKIQDVFEKMST